jgi:hypothetical protein
MPILLLTGANLGVIRTRVKNLVGRHAQISDAEIDEIIQAEHITILGDNSWVDRKAQGTISTVPFVTAGTISVSGTTVTGIGTNFTQALSSRWLRVGRYTEFYQIVSVTDPTHLVIEKALAGGDITDQPYTIFQNVYFLPSDCARVLSMVYQNEIIDTPYEELDRTDPYRTITGIPTRFAYRETVANTRQVEIWPVPTSAFLIRFQYIKTNSLTDDGSIPLYRTDVLVWKAAASCAFMLYAKNGDESWHNLATAYLTQYEKSLIGARLDDLGRNSPASKIRDVTHRSVNIGTDWELDHDGAPW